MDVAVSLMIIFVALIGLSLFPLWFRGRTARTQPTGSTHQSGGIAEQVAAPNSDPFIPMPDYLRTKDEMVTWLIHELPKLTSRQHENRK